MRSNPVLGASAALYAVVGLAAIFAPAEILKLAGSVSPSEATSWPLQLLAAPFFGMATLNWTSRHGAFGGIYGRPLLVANFVTASIAVFVSAAALRHPEARLLPIAVFTASLTTSAGYSWLLFGRGNRGTNPPTIKKP